jgi:acetolactate synthase-1/2/3 large subunit
MRVADYIFLRLSDLGVNKAFGVTGRGSLYLSDAVESNPSIEFIAMHHEQSAGYAAAAYTSAGKPLGVCLVSTGVGASNAMSAVLSAWQDQLPVVFISGQNFSSACSSLIPTTKRTFGEQEYDVVESVKKLTKFATVLKSPSDIKSVMDKLIYEALSGRPGPVWLDVPLDFQSAIFDGTVDPKVGLAPAPLVKYEDVLNYDSAFEIVAKSRKPVVLLGQGAANSSIRNALSKILNSVQIPIVFESSACDVVSTAANHVIGSVGALGGSRAGNKVLSGSDLVICLGSTYRASILGNNSIPSLSQKHLVFDFDALEIPHEMLDAATYLGKIDMKEFKRVVAAVLETSFEEWSRECSAIKANDSKIGAADEPGIDLHDLAKAIATQSSGDAVFVTDSGLIEVIVPNHSPLTPGQRLIHPHSQGAMGYALGASIGAALALKGRPVTVVIGDGSLMMNFQELQSVSTLGLAIRIIVVANGLYSIIRKRQSELFRGRTVGTDESNGVECADLKTTAELFGMEYRLVADLGSLDVALSQEHAFELIEVTGLVSQDYLKIGRALSPRGLLVEGTFDNMLPFINNQER